MSVAVDSSDPTPARKPRICQPKQTYTMDYPEAIKFAETQMEVYWLPTEINVEKDLQDLRINLTPAELHGVVTTLKLFTLYELLVGNEYWGGKIKNAFPRPDIEFMATTFSFVELGIHARFYNRINEVLMLNTDQFYESYIDDEILKERIDFVNEAIELKHRKGLPISVAVFSIMEGAVLYSSFAFLKHFQANGKNLMKNVCTGINMSVRDENIHSEAGAWLFRTLMKETKMTGAEVQEIEERIASTAKVIYEHEARIIDMIFSRGPIEGIGPEAMKEFVKSRVNLCLVNLGLSPVYEILDTSIADWFYKNITGYQFGDFFFGISTEYNRKSAEEDFSW